MLKIGTPIACTAALEEVEDAAEDPLKEEAGLLVVILPRALLCEEVAERDDSIWEVEEAIMLFLVLFDTKLPSVAVSSS